MNRKRTLIGMLTPSSNTALEPITTMMLAGLPDASAHFGRFRVTQIALNDTALKQFDDSNILGAAELLADAELHAIAWNGTIEVLALTSSKSAPYRCVRRRSPCQTANK